MSYTYQTTLPVQLVIISPDFGIEFNQDFIYFFAWQVFEYQYFSKSDKRKVRTADSVAFREFFGILFIHDSVEFRRVYGRKAILFEIKPPFSGRHIVYSRLFTNRTAFVRQLLIGWDFGSIWQIFSYKWSINIYQQL